MRLPDNVESTIDHFSKLPGVGKKTAFRQVMNLVDWSAAEIEAFASSLAKLNQIKRCRGCYFFSDDAFCSICSDINRKEQKTLCVVESVQDLLALEESGKFSGVYFVLGGVLNPLLNIGPEELKVADLKSRVVELGVESIILAINPSVEGDATCSYLRDILGTETVTIERIGFGMPMGGSLEHMDGLTISKALENRRTF